MRILLAAPDRDFLFCYQKILSDALGETVTAFDGTQVAMLLEERTFDLAVLDRELPRISHGQLLQMLSEKRIPVIVLLDRPVSTALLTGKLTANEYLPYPFEPREMLDTVRRVTEKAFSKEYFAVGSTPVRTADFRLGESSRLTASEIDVLHLLLENKRLDLSAGPYISSLNEKLAKAGSNASIKFTSKERFELVVKDE